MIADVLTVDNGSGPRSVALADYLDPAAREEAVAAANRWIKALRHASVDGQPMRRRFTYRGDSLWWFTELYLHKTDIIAQTFRTIIALERLIERERPQAIAVASGTRLVRGLAPAVAPARHVRFEGTGGFDGGTQRMARLRWRARALTMAAHASRWKHGAPRGQGAAIAAFVHTAFWTAGGTDGSAESYIGPVLAALEGQASRDQVRYVGVGPTENFAARRWWTIVRPRTDSSMTPIEAFASRDALAGSREIWRTRHAALQSLWDSRDLRQLSVIRGCDCWPIVREELAGVALLQWPWSARAMDEAAAALEALKPRVAVTYAEAGGWGRALVLECRRRGITSVGLQHGFIYRHWLNYLHEPDEMAAEERNAHDAGFPRPTVTLLFDAYAARHLEQAGRFPPPSLAVTGSARLDALVAAAARVTEEDIARVRADLTGQPGGVYVLVATKFREARWILRSLIEAAGALPGVQLAIKTHPAETPDVYAAVVGDAPHVRVLPAAAPLAPLLRAAAAVATVNSTVALDGLVLGIPALVIGLPNNLSPFVDAGVMAGCDSAAEIRPTLEKILYNQRFSQQLAANRETFLQRFGIAPDGQAAERAAAAIVRLMED